MIGFLTVLGVALLAWAIIEMWWARNGVRCDCSHRWASAIGDSEARAAGGHRYRCLRCQRLMERRKDEWPPTCTDEVDRARDCGWPLCQPIRRPADLPGRAAQLARRVIVWHGVDAPE